jgi:hypothetical protein
MCLSKDIKITKAQALAWALVLCIVNVTAQNKVGIIKNSQLYESSGGGGVCYKNGKIIYSVEGDNIFPSLSSRSVNQIIVFNTSLDTLQTSTLAAGTGTNSGFGAYTDKIGVTRGLSFSYYPTKLSTILFKPSNALFPDTTGHKAYTSKYYRNRILAMYQLKDSSFIGTTAMQTQIPAPVKFGLWWLTKNMDTVRNVYYDFNLWQTGGCLLRNVYELPKKDLLLGGYTDSLDMADGLVMRVDSLGSMKFARSIGTDGFDVLNFIKVKNSYYMYGATDKYGATPGIDLNRLLLIKIDSVGNVINAKLIDNGQGNFFTAYALNYNDELLWYGSQVSPTYNNFCLALLMDTNGVIKKYHKADYNPISNINTQNPRQEFTNAVMDSIKNVYLQMYYYNNGINEFQSGLVKLDSNLVGCTATVAMSFTTTDITSLVHSVPVNYIVKHDSLIRVHGTISQTSGISGIVQSCVAYVGIEELTSTTINNLIKLYPNPSAGMFNFELINTDNAEVAKTIEVYNSMGTLVKRMDISAADISGTIDLTEFSNGIYFINIISANNVIHNTKINVLK